MATWNRPWNLTYSYDQYGNGTCVMNAGTQGLCPQYTFNPANNHISNTGYTYDAAGDLLWDGSSNYEYDAEGRVKHSYSTGQWQYPTYNALGQRVEDYQGTATDSLTLSYPIDIFGQRGSADRRVCGLRLLTWPMGKAADLSTGGPRYRLRRGGNRPNHQRHKERPTGYCCVGKHAYR